MKQFKNSPSLAILLIIIIPIQSCVVWRPLGEPYSQTIPRSLRPGSEIKLHLANGSDIGTVEVKEVWQDSLLVESRSKAILITDVSLVKERKISVGLTLMAVGIPLAIIAVVILGMNASNLNSLVK